MLDSFSVNSCRSTDRMRKYTKSGHRMMTSLHGRRSAFSIVCRLLFLALSLSVSSVSLSRIRRDDYQYSRVNSFSHVWRDTDFSDCSVSCGTGIETTEVVCYDPDIDLIADERHCDPVYRPSRRIRTCFRRSCDRLYTWVAGDWGPCSRTCGTGGIQLRTAYCVGESDDGYSLLPSDDDGRCDLQKRPPGERPCTSLQACPTWIPGQWSLCSVTCGTGYQLRAVVCQQTCATDACSQQCSMDMRPVDRRLCRPRVTCLGEQLSITPGNDTDDQEGAQHGADSDLNDYHAAAILDPNNLNPFADWRGTEIAENQPGSTPPLKLIGTYGDADTTGSSPSLVDTDVLNAPSRPEDEDFKRGVRSQPLSHDGLRLQSRPGYDEKFSSDAAATWSSPQRRRSSRHLQLHHPSFDEDGVHDDPMHPDPMHPVFVGRPDDKDEIWRNDFQSQIFPDNVGSGSDYDSTHLETVEAAHSVHSTDIVVDTSNFIQFQKLSAVTLVIGGSASILDQTSVYIVCSTSVPRVVGGKDRRHGRVMWTKDGNVIAEFAVQENASVGVEDVRTTSTRRPRYIVQQRGSVLRIRNFRKTDAGVYTCFVASIGRSADSTLRHVTADEAADQMEATRAALYYDGGPEAAATTEVLEKVRQGLSTVGDWGRLPRVTDVYSTSYSVWNMMELMGLQLPVVYIPLKWSRCSARCGRGGGIHRRNVTCSLLSDRWQMDIDDHYCGEPRPITEKDCTEQGDCPQWEPEQWGKCSSDVCLGPGLGIRRRVVHCTASSSRDRLNDDQCNAEERPTDNEMCTDHRCQVVWIPYGWSKCRGVCGRPGVKTRVVRCVWAANKQPTSGEHCGSVKRPASFKPCLNDPCKEPGVTAVCRDEFKHCQMIVVLQMCRYSQYQTGCCRTCSLVAAAAAAAA